MLSSVIPQIFYLTPCFPLSKCVEKRTKGERVFIPVGKEHQREAENVYV
jgi:hypothetical protein